MSDKMGKLPSVKTAQEALKTILWIANDKRGHLLTEEHMAWLTLKLRAIRILARRGLKMEQLTALSREPQEEGE